MNQNVNHDSFFSIGSARKQVEAMDVFGYKKIISADKLSFRPSAYGILLKKDSVLLEFNPQFQLWTLPGGGIELGELNETCVKREFLEETNLEVEVDRLLETETAFYLDPKGSAHSLLFYYLVKLKNPQQKINFNFNNHNDAKGLKFIEFNELQQTNIGLVFQNFLIRNFLTKNNRLTFSSRRNR